MQCIKKKKKINFFQKIHFCLDFPKNLTEILTESSTDLKMLIFRISLDLFNFQQWSLNKIVILSGPLLKI